MGYTTEFTGKFTLDKPLVSAHRHFLGALAATRRMRRDPAKAAQLPDPIREAAGLEVGVDGQHYVGGAYVSASGAVEAPDFGQAEDDSVVERNRPPSGQPGLWCQWTPNADGTVIAWDGGGEVLCVG